MSRTSFATSDPPATQLVISWLLLVPLLYFADQGGFWFQRADLNNELAARYGALAHQASTVETAAMACTVFAICLVAGFPHVHEIIRLARRNKLLLAISFLAITSSLWSQFPLKTLEWSVCLAADTFFAFYFCYRFSPDRQLQLFTMLGCCCFTLSILLALFSPRYGISFLDGKQSWQGLYFHKNLCALSTLFLLPNAIYHVSRKANALSFRVVYIIMSIFLIFMSQSRTGWFATLFLFFYVFAIKVIQKFRSYDRLLLMIFFLIMMVVLVSGTYMFSEKILVLIGKNATLTGRTDIWISLLSSALKRPFWGYGYMGFWRGYEGESANASLTNGWAVSSAHNGFLELWLSLGAVGVALVLGTFWRALTQFNRQAQSLLTPYQAWCGSVVMLTLFISMDEEQMLVPNNLIWIMFMVASIGLAQTTQCNTIRNADA